MKRAGHQEAAGETIAQFEFWQHDWNPFIHFIDHEQVDLVLRGRRDGRVQYRDVQVKYGRFYSEVELASWQHALFSRMSWRKFAPDEFSEDRPNLFVAMVLGGGNGLNYEGDIFIFTSREFHALIQEAPLFSRKAGTREICFAQARDGGGWYVPKQRSKFTTLTTEHVIDVTHARRNFAVLDRPR